MENQAQRDRKNITVGFFARRRMLLLTIFLFSFTSFVSEVGASCSTALFECLDEPGKCIPKSWMCDETPDCPDGSDESELFCDHKGQEVCNSTRAFKCSDGKCIQARWVCDGEPDCPNGEDEKKSLCPCKPGHFLCADGERCLPQRFVCDETPDCPGGDDEANCPSQNCTAAEFRCGDGKCINAGWVCDKSPDCDDGSDEKNCPEPTCDLKAEFMCSNGRCVPVAWRCDGDADCQDSSDEENCPKSNKTSPCNPQEWQCDTGLECVRREWMCDGDPDCSDKSDESAVNCHVSKNDTCRADQFRCEDGACIPEHLRCDGIKQCTDGSDELSCRQSVFDCNPAKEFACTSPKFCIPLNRVCDGTKDCGDGSDEPADKCHVDECAIHNGGCQYECVNTPTGFKCKCPPGFQLVNSTHCQDVDECSQWGVCSQRCLNFPGTHKCECFPGYVKDVNNPHKCRATEGPPSLLFTNVVDVRKMDLASDGRRRDTKLVVSHTRSATALDYAYKSRFVFWSDVNDHRIYRAHMDNPEVRTAIITEDVVRCDGLAVDWIHELLYWTSSETNAVEVAKLDGSKRMTLFRGEPGSKPRAVAVDPSEGWLFWSDWSTQKPKIERVGMDGSHRTVIVGGYGIEWPNGLTIDHIAMRLYWIDAKLHQISSVKFDGTDRRVVLSSTESLHHPFSLSVFEDYVYWTDWTQKAIFKASKFNGTELEKLTPEGWEEKPNVIHVYHPHRQMETPNSCGKDNGMCSYLCLPAPQFRGYGLIDPESRRKRAIGNDDRIGFANDFHTDDLEPRRYTCGCPDGHVLRGEFECVEEGKIYKPRKPQPSGPEITNTEEPPSSTTERNSIPPGTDITHAPNGTGVDNGPGDIGSNSPVKSESQPVSATRISVIVFLSVLVTFFMSSMTFFAFYKGYLKPKQRGMDFDNPAYKKTTDNVSTVSIQKSTPSSGSPAQSSRKSYPGENPESLEPLNQEKGDELV